MRTLVLLSLLSFGVMVRSAAATQVCTEGELRAALESGGEIRFACDTLIELTNTLKIERDVILDGGTNEVILSGGGAVRIFEVSEGVSFTLRDIHVVNGRDKGTNAYPDDVRRVYVPGTDGFGGAMAGTNATILIQACVFSNNVAIGGDSLSWPDLAVYVPGGAAAGGAIFAENCHVEIVGSHFATNQTTGQRKAEGGAIQGRGGVLHLKDSGFTGNLSKAGGGAVSVQDAELVVDGCRFEFNRIHAPTGSYSGSSSGSGRGGALEIAGETASITNSEFVGNFVGGAGGYHGGTGDVLLGGAIASAQAVTILNSSFVDNVIAGAGAVYPAGKSAGGALWAGESALISGSRFIGNQVIGGEPSTRAGAYWGLAGSAFGGAICADGRLEMNESTIVSNVVRGGWPFFYWETNLIGNALGSGIFATNLQITNVTVAFNHAEGTRPGLVGGAVHLGNGGSAAENQIAFSTFATNHIVIRDSSPPPPQQIFYSGVRHVSVHSNSSVTMSGTILSGGADSVEGEVIDRGYNTSGGDLFTQATSLNNADPKLGTIGFYGGFTETIPVRTGSPAINAVVTGTFPSTDQRGRSRPYGSGADIGAYEVSPPFVVQGRVRTHGGQETVRLFASGELVEVDHSTGDFVGFFDSSGDLLPVRTGIVFLPSEVALTPGVELFKVNFVGYKFDEVAVEKVAGDAESLVITFAAETEGEYQLQVSDDLRNWTEVEVQNVRANGLFRTEITADAGHQFFQVMKL